ncbi:HD family hydrolase [Oricola thermophila]|uniref:HD family hydrolase n=1 Tax=Oricola thermophila TaxID=2742145 RepID=A0A6N1VBR6_9HYPH|nr:HD family hydrolase [Oricola thermophila]QKV18461.1 HD family hydrolase [Oricola thermophila]
MPDRIGAPPRAWQRMLSGRRLDLLDPSPLDIEISDIAHGLARVARWNGQTSGDHAYSVAQHSLLVEEIVGHIVPTCSAQLRLATLLHDAPEYVIGDMISPFKKVLGGNYKAVEARLEAAIHIRFGLPAHCPKTMHAQIKRADQISAFYEATLLAGFSEREAVTYFGRPRGYSPDGIDMTPLPASEIQQMYLSRFAEVEAMFRDEVAQKARKRRKA